jgi:hypothetical protein
MNYKEIKFWKVVGVERSIVRYSRNALNSDYIYGFGSGEALGISARADFSEWKRRLLQLGETWRKNLEELTSEDVGSNSSGA